MEFICIKQCFRNNNLYDIGMKMESNTDISIPEKEGHKPCWQKVGKGTDKAEADAKEFEKIPYNKLRKMDPGEIVIYTFNRFKGTVLDAHTSKTAMIKEITLLENEKAREVKMGIM